MRLRTKTARSGSMLIEVMMSMSLLAVGILVFCSSFLSVSRASGEVSQQDEVRVAMENVFEFLRSRPFDSLYQDYHLATLEVPNLKGPSGGPGTAEIRFHVNETTLPTEFGPLLDIDGNPSSNNTECSGTYKVLPAQITLRYMGSNGVIVRNFYVVLRRS